MAVGRKEALAEISTPLHDEKVSYPVEERGLYSIGAESEYLFPFRMKTEIAYATLNLEQCRPSASLTAVETVEARSIIGCYEFVLDDLVFVPGRLHLGPARKIDTRLAALQTMLIPSFREAVSSYSSEQTITLSILREGPVLNLQENLYLATGLIPRDHVFISVSHVIDPDGHKGLSGEVNYFRHEVPSSRGGEIKQVVVADSIAGGRNVIGAMERLFNDFPKIDQMTVVSIHASLAGVERVLTAMPSQIKEIRFFCLNGVLAASAKNHYDCFFPTHRLETLPDERDGQLMRAIYGNSMVPFAGNWAANFYNPGVARQVLEEQLADLGMSLEEVLERSRQINSEKLEEIGFDFRELMPISALIEGRKLGLAYD